MCPNCGQTLKQQNLENQKVLHCQNCGGSFFEENGINRITIQTAKRLHDDRKIDLVSGKSKLCPHDKAPLSPITNSEAIPAYVSLLQCSKCHGVFAYPEDLLAFKKAQDVKVEFLKIWKIPLSALKSVLVLTFILGISFSTFLAISTYLNRTAKQANAQDLLKNLKLSQYGTFLFLSFQTPTPFTSQVELLDSSQKVVLEKIISPTPKTIHILTFRQSDLKNVYFYQIILKDQANREFRSDKLSFPRFK